MTSLKTIQFLLIVGLFHVRDGQGQETAPLQIGTNSVLILSADDLDEEQRLKLIQDYVKEMTSPLKPPGPQYSHIMLLDTNSFVRDTPGFLRMKKDLDIVDHDIRKEIIDTPDDVFAQVYKDEFEIEAQFHSTANHLCFGGQIKVNQSHLEHINRNIFTYPRHYKGDPRYRKAIGDFISKQFGSIGLITGFQQFTPTQFLNLFYDATGNINQLPVGSNVFGIYPGTRWGTPSDRLVIVGAHWDTFEGTDGFNDNGSGVTAVMEVARLLRLYECRPKNTIIFVTFDLEEVGNQGSLEFIQRFLLPNIVRKYHQPDIIGAIITDTVLNYNSTVQSQIVSDQLRQLLPDTAEAIEEGDFRGDFINLIQREKFDDLLGVTFAKHWQRVTNGGNRLISSKLPFESGAPSQKSLQKYLDHLRSDHSRFWIANQTDFQSIRAILLTDTGPNRGLMKNCYHSHCDSIRNGHTAEFANFTFFRDTVQTMVDTVLELSESQCTANQCVDKDYYTAKSGATSAFWKDLALAIGSIILVLKLTKSVT